MNAAPPVQQEVCQPNNGGTFLSHTNQGLERPKTPPSFLICNLINYNTATSQINFDSNMILTLPNQVPVQMVSLDFNHNNRNVKLPSDTTHSKVCIS